MARRVTPKVLNGFLTEARGYLPRIRESVAAFAKRPDQPGELEEAYRLMHTIKGTASMIGLDDLGRVAGGAEDVLEELLTSRRKFNPDVGDSLQAAFESIATKLFQAGGVTADLALEVVADASEDPELAATVTEEFRGYLETIGARLRALETEPTRLALLDEIRGPLHTMKGTAGIVGMVEVSRLAHRTEDLLTALDRRQQPIGEVELKMLFGATDLLIDLIDDGSMTDALKTRLEATHQGFTEELKVESTGTAPVVEDRVTSLPVPPSRQPAELPSPAESMLRVRADRLDGVLRLLGDVTLQRAGFDRQVMRMNELRAELQLHLRRLGRMARQLTTELDSGGLASSAAAVSMDRDDLAASEFDSLEMDRYTQLNLLARQLEEAATDSAAVGSGFEGVVRQVEGYQTRLGLLTRDVQERLAQLRTVRFSTLSSRLHRTVRVTAEKRGKLVALEIEGGDVELDKDVLEEILEPLLHLLRNAVDHGIESEQARHAAGKLNRGRVNIRVAYQGTEATIQVQDDGGGLDVERLSEQARALGILAPVEAETATPELLHSLIFRRGFTTARQISEVSGRGIGLDVASASIAGLRGMLEVASEPGIGTTFTIRLPGSQSILRVLVITSGGESLAVPLALIERVESIQEVELQDVGGDRKVKILDEFLPALELGETLGMPPRRQDGSSSIPVVVLRVGDRRIALLAERILGVQEVVNRAITELFSKRLYGIGGAALTGDGEVVLVLNPNDLLFKPSVAGARATTTGPRQRPVVLIVDDSLSVRQVLGRLMDRNGWRPLVARDGKDALELLKRTPRIPEVAIVDLEMPRMDGYELTRALRARDAYRGMPIVILTTRAGEKHRRKAFELGANDFLIKPFQEKTLLATIRRVTRTLSEQRP